MTLGEEHIAWWVERLTEPCFVYVLQTGPGEPVKIGKATDVSARISDLQSGNPYRLRAIYALPGSYELEWQFHQKLAKHRLEGEWFSAEGAEPLFPMVERLGIAMMAAYDGTGVAPTYRLPGFSWKRRPRRAGKIIVRSVEPNPVPPDMAAKRLREAWMRPRRSRSNSTWV